MRPCLQSLAPQTKQKQKGVKAARKLWEVTVLENGLSNAFGTFINQEHYLK
jgi:hypothetical protein